MKMNFDVKSEGVFAEVLALSGQSDPRQTIKAYLDHSTQAYWEKKDVPLVIALSVAGISYGFQIASKGETTDVELRTDILGTAKAIAYNLASFMWPGWNESGITLGATDLRIGLDAANTNLRLAQELSKGSLPMSRAYWILGAQLLANGRYQGACDAFDHAATFAIHAKSKSEELLCLGFSLLSQMVSEPENTASITRLDEIKSALVELENGANFIEQIETASRVFKRDVPLQWSEFQY